MGNTEADAKRTFIVDVNWKVAGTYEIEAKDAEEAKAIVQKMVDDGEVCVWTDNFEATDDVEVSVAGEATDDEVKFY